MMSTHNNTKCLLPIVSLYTVLWALFISGTYSEVILAHFVINISSLIIPIWFFIGNVVSEVYGYYYFKKLITWAFMVQIASFILMLLINGYFSHALDSRYYLQLIYNLPKIIIANMIALVGYKLISDYIIPRFKSLLEKKYFILRGNGVSVIGELYFIVVVNLISLYGVYALTIIFKIIISAVLFYLITNICLILPSNIIVSLLKRIEYVKAAIVEISAFDVIRKYAKFEDGNNHH